MIKEQMSECRMKSGEVECERKEGEIQMENTKKTDPTTGKEQTNNITSEV